MSAHPSGCRPLPTILITACWLLLNAGCDHGLRPVGPGTTGLRGTVTFSGTWPADTGLVVVALFPREPSPSDLVYPVTWQTVTQQDITTFDYVLQPPPGRYEYLTVAWQRQGASIFDLSEWVEIGFHPDAVTPSEPAVVLLEPGQFLEIDMAADFSFVPPAGTPQ